jgi:hypothetical protein
MNCGQSGIAGVMTWKCCNVNTEIQYNLLEHKKKTHGQNTAGHTNNCHSLVLFR